MENDVISEIKQRIGIQDVIGERVRLTRAGHNLKGLCPFHSEKTPSFIVYPKDGSYHCFGCGASGDIFTFLVKTEGLDFRGALERLAAQAGVELRPRSDHAAAEERTRERLKEACAATALFYNHLLLTHPAAAQARAYVEKRGISASTVETFQIGFAPDSWDALNKHLASKGFTAQEMLDAGLVAERDEGGHYDRFRNRLIFPIRDHRGAVVGFGARALAEGQTPKYLNSPQSVLFDKSNILYGFDLARQQIQRTGQVVIVEGYADVVMAHQMGQRNVVGTIGTALTDRHAEHLKRIAKRIILCLDPDTAGDMAALKGSEVLQEHAERIAIPVRGERGLMGVERRSDIEIRIMQLPRGLDPDELLLSEGGPQRWEELRESALPLVDHVIRVAAGKYDLKTAHGKSDAVADMALFIREIGDPVQRAHYTQRVADALRVPVEAVQEALGRGRGSVAGGRGSARTRAFVDAGDLQSPRSQIQNPPGLPQPIDPAVAPEEHLLSLVIKYPQVTWMAYAPVPDDFARLENRLLYEAVREAASSSEQSSAVDPETLRNRARDLLDPVLQSYFDRLLVRDEPELYRFALPHEAEKRLIRLREHNDRMWVQQCQLMVKEAEETGDRDTINKLMPLFTRSLTRFRHYNPRPSTVFRDSRD